MRPLQQSPKPVAFYFKEEFRGQKPTIRAVLTESSAKLLSKDMAPSSLKKMSGFRRMTEGNYASLEKSLWDSPVNSDLGLTLLPGSQIQTKDEKGLGFTAESSPKEAGNEHDEMSEQPRSFGAEVRVKNSTQESAFPDEAKNPRSSPIPGSESANLSYVAADLNRARPFSQISIIRNDRSAVQDNADSAHAALFNEQQMGSSEIRNTKSCQHGSYSSRLAKWKKFGPRASNEIQGSKVSKVIEPAFETHNDASCMHYNQGLYKTDTIQSGNRLESVGIMDLPLSGTGGGSKSSKPEFHRHIKCSLDVAPERIFPSLIAFASKSPAKHPHYPSRNLSEILTQQLRHSRLPPDTQANIRAQLLKSRKRVNKRSWSTYFPAKARFSPHTKIPVTSFLVASSTPRSQILQHQNLINPTLTSTNLHPYTTFSSTSPSHTFLNYPSISKAFDDLISLDPLVGTLNTAHTGNHPQSAPRRSASMPNLWSTRAPTRMGSSNNFMPTSMPTPPSELESFNLHPRQNHARFTAQDVSGPSMPMNSAMAAGGLQHHRQPLEMKSNYSCEEVKSLISHVTEQAKNLKAENVKLWSSNTALGKHVESLRSEKGAMTEVIQHHERTMTQKHQQNEAMRQEVMSMQQQRDQSCHKYFRLIATLRKDNGTGNPSAIAQRIRQGHAPNTTSPASQCNQPNRTNVNAPTVRLANREQLSISRPEFEQRSSGLQGQPQVQPLSVSGGLEADVRDASSRSLQQARTRAIHNRTNLLQTMSYPAYPEANPANTSSQASVTPGFVAANRNMKFPHDQPTRCVPPIMPFDAAVGAVTTDIQNNKRPIGHVSSERVTIDLTDESQPPVRSASCSHPVHQTSQLAVQDGHSPFNLLPGQYSPPQDPALNRAQSQSPSGLSAQKQSLKDQMPLSRSSQSPDQAMQIQREAIARMAKKPLDWLEGGNPFKKEAKFNSQSVQPNLRQTSKGSAGGLVIPTDSPKEGSVAPLPETATGRESRAKVPGKARAALTAEARKERARIYRKKAADKKKREEEATKQLLQAETISTNAMRAQKQERRATKEGKRQEQSRNPSGGVGLQESQKTLDVQLYQKNTSVLQAVHQESVEQAPSDDHDSLFGDDEDGQIEMEDSETSPEADSEILEDGVDSAYVAELEAQLSADADATMWMGLEQIDTLGSGDGHVGRPCESEESEEE